MLDMVPEEKFEHDLQKHVNVLERALSQLGQGIIVLSAQGRILFMTDVASQMVARKDGLVVEQGYLTGVFQADNDRLQMMCQQAVSLECESYNSFYIHRNKQKKPYLLLISKMAVADDNTVDGVLLIIKDTHANAEHWQERLKTVFGLTKREADFVVLLTEGRNIKEISLVMEIAEDTARQYLKNCFKKMEVNKQHELVCLAMDSLRKR